MSEETDERGLFRRLLSRRTAAPMPDAADLGTCIGLEFSLDQPAAPTRAAPSPAVSTGWVRRLASRRMPVA